jgi:tRNA A-37 threonylcarbamoyl transferase component Bud32
MTLQVVMEDLRERDGWRNMADLGAAEQQEAKGAVLSAISKLHGIRNPASIVHGDLRTANILLRRGAAGWSNAEVMIIDWDCE